MRARDPVREDFHMRTVLKRVIVVFILILIFAIISFGFATRAKEDPASCPRTLPENIELPRDLERILARVYRGSATFRAQCDRIGAARTLSVNVRLDTAIPSSYQAFTMICRRGHALRADVHLPPTAMAIAELVGHEFEHILEQLDGLNLRMLSHVRGSGVRESSFDVYETTRAQRIGRIVAAELSAPQTGD
jgi:hypothetical protein